MATAAQPASSLLAYMLHRHLDFRDCELQAVSEMHGLPKERLNARLMPGCPPWSPFRLVDMPSEQVASAIAQRALFLKGFFEIWGTGSTLAELKESIRSCPSGVKDPWFQPDVSFKYVVDGFGQKITLPQQLEYMNSLADVCPFKGKVDLTNPRMKIWVIVCNGSGNGMQPGVPNRLIAAREVALGNHRSVQRFLLKDRRYIGPTSMDTELAFAMCNMAHVQPGRLVFDPFAGTGSILIAAAVLGAHTMGGDIDVRVIRDGKLDKQGRDVNVYSNFADYKLREPLGLLRMDAHNPPWRRHAGAMFDAIVCDPPYGVRAGGRKMVAREPTPGAPPLDKSGDYVPSTKAYTLGECLRDLLDTSARLLVLGGRLTYWMPDFNDGESNEEVSDQATCLPAEQVSAVAAARDAVAETSVTRASRGAEVPMHPCLRVVANSKQVLSTRYLRRLITMVKCKHYDDSEIAAWKATLGDPTMAIDTIHATVFQPKEAFENKHALAEPDGSSPKKKRFRGKRS